MKLPKLKDIISVKPEPPETTPLLSKVILRPNAVRTVKDYLFTPSLRSHFQQIFDCAVHRKGQGFWVQAEYGAGKTHFLGTLVNLLVWREENTWNAVRDEEVRNSYGQPLSKIRMFPVAFSLRGMGTSGGMDSLMLIFEEQIRESLRTFAPEIEEKIPITSEELADYWYRNEATDWEKAGAKSFFEKEHKASPEDFRKDQGVKKFGRELVRSGLPLGKLRGKFKERFTWIYDQITKLGEYDGLLFVVDEFRSWQDRHVQGTAAYAEDEEVLETLAYVLPTQHLNILTVIASQGDIPQKLSGGGEGDRFIPLYLLADKNKGDFGEIVAFRCRDLQKGAEIGIKDYYDHCRKEYRFIRQAHISHPDFEAIFPFQPRCFEVMRRITQNAEKHNLPTARSAIRMGWQSLSEPSIQNGTRLVTIPDIVHTDELIKGLNHEVYKESYQNLQGTVEQISTLDVSPEERDQAHRILETLFLWAISLPDNLRDGLTSQEVAEAAWLADEAVGAKDQAEHLLEKLLQNGFPVREEKKTREGKTVAVYSYELSAAQANPVKYFAPLKKKSKEDVKAQNDKWLESLFWQLTDITPEAQEASKMNGGLLSDFQPPDQRTAKQRQGNASPIPIYTLPHRAASSTSRVHKVQYGGEVVVSDRWRDEFGKEIENPDQHFRLVYLTQAPDPTDDQIAAQLKDARISVCRPAALCDETREALAEILAAEQMKKNFSALNQGNLRDHAEGRRKEAVKTILKCQLDEYKRGKVLTQKGYGIPAIEVFGNVKDREEALSGRLLEKAYDTPLFAPKHLKKVLTDNDARKVFAGLFHKDPANAEKDAVTNFAAGLGVVSKSHPTEFNAGECVALARIKELAGSEPDLSVSDIKSAFCRAPHALTDHMVVLYLLGLVKAGGYELVIRPNHGLTLKNGKGLTGDRITNRVLGLIDWNAKLDKALLGARLVKSSPKGWNDVLPYARVLDEAFKPVASPDEEDARNEDLVRLLKTLYARVADIRTTLPALSQLLEGKIAAEMTELLQRLEAISVASDFHEFTATVRESYATPEAFKQAFDRFSNLTKACEALPQLQRVKAYVQGAADLADSDLELRKVSLLGQLTFDGLVHNPQKIKDILEQFNGFTDRYQQAYRKAHRAYHEQLTDLYTQFRSQEKKILAVERLNQLELGATVEAGLRNEYRRILDCLEPCTDKDYAKVEQNPVCPLCRLSSKGVVPDAEIKAFAERAEKAVSDLTTRVAQGAVRKVLEQSGDSDVRTLLDVILASQTDRLPEVLIPEVIGRIKKLLYDANLELRDITVREIIGDDPALEEQDVDTFLEGVRERIKAAFAKARQDTGGKKRIRFFLR
jgi:hypothetical protein